MSDQFLVISTILVPAPDGSGTAQSYYVGPFPDAQSATAHAAQHNARPHTMAVVQPLLSPAEC